MYNIKDYAINGLTFANNMLRQKHKKLTSLMIYATTRCNSKCKHCNIWQKEVEDLSLQEIINIMKSKCITKQTTIGLEGGEFLLHPNCDNILQWFCNNHKNFTLLSNGLIPSKIIDVVKKYSPKRLYLSLDGKRESYKYMRGIDGYDKVIYLIESLHNQIPISLMFCLSPFNAFEDMRHVIDIALKYNVDIRIGIYATISFFDTKNELLSCNKEKFVQSIPTNILKTEENFDFVKLYPIWREKNLHINCHSIYSQLVIHANGNVPLCQNLDITLGNIRNTPLDKIFNSIQTINLHSQYCKSCNSCWINYHRKFDIILLRNLERFLPKQIIEKFYGNYNWCNNKQLQYKDIIK